MDILPLLCPLAKIGDELPHLLLVLQTSSRIDYESKDLYNIASEQQRTTTYFFVSVQTLNSTPHIVR